MKLIVNSLKLIKTHSKVIKSHSKLIYIILISTTIPLEEQIFENPTRALESVNLSIKLPGHQLHLFKNKPNPVENYIFQKEVPHKFWEILHSQYRLPSDEILRRKFTSKIFDLKHRHLCNRPKSEFHNQADPMKCKCKNCKKPMDWYHECHDILTVVAS